MAATILGLSATTLWAGDSERSQKADEGAMFRNSVLNRYDDNHNGRLDSKEKALALKELTGRNTSDDDVNALRSQILARFDKNHNGKLEKSEVRTALSTVNVKPQAPANDPSASSACTVTPADRRRVAAAIQDDPTAAVVFTAQQLTKTGLDTETAQAMAVQRFDLNGDGVLDQSELALAQSLLLQQLAQASAAASLSTPTTLATTATGTTTTGTSTGSTSSQTGTMSGGCSGSGGSGSGSGTSGSGSGTSGSGSTSTGTSNSALQNANNQASSNFGNAFARSRGFGGGRGR
jgi:Ca2+-binding EF-hand superfamily protein